MTSTSDSVPIGLFEGLAPDVVDAIAAELRQVRVGEGELLWRQGDVAESLHVVAGGAVEVSVRAPGEREVVLGTFGPGEILGELPLLAGGVRAATVRALEPSRLLVFDRARFEAMLAGFDPAAMALRRRLLEVVCARLRAAHADLAAALGGGEPPEALAALPAPADRPSVGYVTRLEFFRRFAAVELEDFLASADVVNVGRGDVLLPEGADPAACVLTLNGALEELVRRGDRAVRLRLAGPGVATCYVGMIDGRASSVQVRARERARVVFVRRDVFDELFSATTRGGRAFVEAVQRDLVTALRLAQRPQARLHVATN